MHKTVRVRVVVVGGGGQTPCILINRRFLLTSVLVIEGLFA